MEQEAEGARNAQISKAEGSAKAITAKGNADAFVIQKYDRGVSTSAEHFLISFFFFLGLVKQKRRQCLPRPVRGKSTRRVPTSK